MPLRRAARGFTLIELLIVIAIIGIVAAILIPNFLDALHKGKQKRTMGGMRDAGSAWFAWLSDQYGGAAAAGAEVTKYPLPETDYGYEQTQADLVPVYIQELIESDGWGNPLVYCRAPDDDLQTESSVLAILSPGRDGQPGPVVNAGCGVEVEFGAFEPTAYDLDIVWADGFFVRFPQKTSAGGQG